MRLPNPLIPGFNPDPSVVRVGDCFYLATSTFEYLPGVPIYRSTDLAQWELIGHVVTRPGQLDVEHVPTGGGAWAPTIRWHDGLFWVVIADAMGRGMLIFTAIDPAGPWSDGIAMVGASGIDPDIAWDDDGACIVTYSALVLTGADTGKHLGIQQVRIDPTSGHVLETPRDIWSGTGLMFPEAPHLYRHDGWWYLIIAEGGTERGHTVSVARSTSPYGPFEGCPANPILSARSTARPVQNTGHADLVQALDGSWHLVLLGVRVLGMTRSFSPLGRETFATPVTWVDGWPVAEPVELTADLAGPRFADDFAAPTLGLEWIAVRRRPADVAVVDTAGLTLRGEGRDMSHPQPTFVGRRQRRLDAQIAADVRECTGVGGLTVRYDEHFHVDLELDGRQLTARSCAPTMSATATATVPAGPLTLVLEMEVSRPPSAETGFAGAMSSDTIHAGYLDGERFVEVAAFDGRMLTAETACSFTGRVAGVYCVSGTLTVSGYREDGCGR